MASQVFRSRAVIVAFALVALAAGTAWASIENEPVKVTHRNSGPRYDIDDVERTKLSPDSNEVITSPRRPQQQPGEQAATDDEPVSIRRIFLVPMMPARSSPDSPSLWMQPFGGQRSAPESSAAESSPAEQQSPSDSLFGEPSRQPFWPFSPIMRHHLFGADSASRSPTPDESNERPTGVERPPSAGLTPAAAGEREDIERPVRPLIDPIQMMIDLMQQALNPSGSSASGGVSSFFNDLNKEASQSGTSSTNSNDQEKSDNKPTNTELEQPAVKPPMSKNETREDVVEIDGKKYLRKTVINRHVGENIIFMTKRLIFIPLNETETDSIITTTTTTTSPIAPATGEPIRKVEEVTTTSTTSAPTSTITTTTSEVPSTEAATEPSTTTTTTAAVSSTQASGNKEETTPRASGLDKETTGVGDRLLAEGPSSTTTKPVASS